MNREPWFLIVSCQYLLVCQLSACLCLSRSVCMSVWLYFMQSFLPFFSVFLSVCLSVCISFSLFFRLSFWFLIVSCQYMCVNYISVYDFLCLSVFLSVCLYINFLQFPSGELKMCRDMVERKGGIQMQLKWNGTYQNVVKCIFKSNTFLSCVIPWL